jgi:Chromo (CHRromatin Organisation MOdifier) domain
MKIHPVFSVVKLRPYVANELPERVIKQSPPPVIVDGTEQYEVEEILNSRKYRGHIQYLIKWKDFPTEDNSWEPASVIHEDVPLMVKEFHLTHPNAIRTIFVSTLPVK